MISIRVMPYTYVYGILVNVYKIRIFSWHNLTYTDHYVDLILHDKSLIFCIRLCLLTVYDLSEGPYTAGKFHAVFMTRACKLSGV